MRCIVSPDHIQGRLRQLKGRALSKYLTGLTRRKDDLHEINQTIRAQCWCPDDAAAVWRDSNANFMLAIDQMDPAEVPVECLVSPDRIHNRLRQLKGAALDNYLTGLSQKDEHHELNQTQCPYATAFDDLHELNQAIQAHLAQWPNAAAAVWSVWNANLQLVINQMDPADVPAAYLVNPYHIYDRLHQLDLKDDEGTQNYYAGHELNEAIQRQNLEPQGYWDDWKGIVEWITINCVPW